MGQSPEGRSGGLSPRARVVLAGTAALCLSAQPLAAPANAILPLVLALGLVASLWLVLGGRGGHDVVHRRTSGAQVGAALVMAWTGVLVGSLLGLAPSALLGVMAGLALLGWVATGSGSWSLAAHAGLLGCSTVISLMAVHSRSVRIDVAEFARRGAAALLRGDNPYAMWIPNVFNAAETEVFYAPGVVEGGFVTYGYPYLPAPLVASIPGHLAGDIRYVHIACVVVVACMARRWADDAVGRMVATVLAAAPMATVVVLNFWVEPVMGLFLVAAAGSMLAGRRGSGVWTGLLLCSKQYLIVILPVLWVVRLVSGWRSVLTAVGLAGGVILAFFAWDPSAFIRSAVLFQFEQPFRDDSVSLLPVVADLAGRPPTWLSSAVSLGVGAGTCLLISTRLRADATTYLLGVGLPLLAMVLVSKQAFTNYYWFIGTALALAVVTSSPRRRPGRDPGASVAGLDARPVVPGVAGGARHRDDEVGEPAQAPQEQPPAHQGRHMDAEQQEEQSQARSDEHA